MIIKSKQLLKIILYISIFQGFFSDYLGLSIINYLCDFFIICILLLRMRGIARKNGDRKEKRFILIPLVCFFVVVLIGWLFSSTSLLHALWGIRNNARFFIYFYLCVDLFDKSDCNEIIDFLIKLFPVNCIFMFYQLFVEHLSYDYLGGIFGRYQGCAGGLNIYFGLVMIILLSKYDNKKIELKKLFVYYISILFFAALSELKALFLFLFVLLIIYALFSKRKINSIIVLLFSLLGLFIGINILTTYFPSYVNFFSVENIIRQLTDKNASYTYREGLDVGRSSIFYKLEPVITSWGGNVAKWFGLGLGNCDYSSSFSFLNSAFYNAYSRSNYIHFSLGFLFAETGYLGTISYVMYFVFLEIIALKHLMKKKDSESLVSILLPIFCFMLIFYNCSLRTNFAYMMFSMLSIIIQKKSYLIMEDENRNEIHG